MVSFPMVPGVEVNLFLLVFVGLGAGVVSGFAGVGGGFFMTPALIILGLPANFAVGISMAWVVANSVVGSFRHRQMGNVDVRLGLVTLGAAVAGTEVGVQLLNFVTVAGVADEGVLALSTAVLLATGGYMVGESARHKRRLDQDSGSPDGGEVGGGPWRRLQALHIPPMVHLATSGVRISLWVLLPLGFAVGVLAGVMGVGGAVVMVPALVYVVGAPSFVAVGTGLFQTIFTGAYGTVRHSMSGNVVLMAAAVLVVASSSGVQFGAQVTRYVRGVSMRYVFGIMVLLSALGAAIKLAGTLVPDWVSWTTPGSKVVIFGSLGLAVGMIVLIFFMGVRHSRGRSVPSWMASLMAGEPS